MSERAGRVSRPQPGKGGRAAGGRRKKPNALAARAAEDSGLSNSCSRCPYRDPHGTPPQSVALERSLEWPSQPAEGGSTAGSRYAVRSAIALRSMVPRSLLGPGSSSTASCAVPCVTHRPRSSSIVRPRRPTTRDRTALSRGRFRSVGAVRRPARPATAQAFTHALRRAVADYL